MTSEGRSPTVAPRRPKPRPGGPVDVLTLYLVALFLIPAPLVFAPLGGAGSPSVLLGLALLLWWFWVGTLPGHRPWTLQPVHVAALLLVAAVLTSFALAMMHSRLPVEVRGADRGLIRVAALTGVMLFTADAIRTRRELHRLVRRLVAIAGVVAVIGLIQYLVGVDLAAMIHIPGLSTNGILVSEDRSVFLRIRSTATHPIESGVVLAMVLPLALHVAMGRRKAGWWQWVSLAAIVVVALLSVSRSAVVGVVIAVGVVFLGWDRRRQLTFLILSPFLLVGLRVAVPGLVGTLRSLFANVNSDPSVSGRTDDYAVVAMYLEDRPLTGMGFGTFIPEVYLTLDNQYLLMLVETGLLGLVALASLFLVGWCCARGSRIRSVDADDRQLGQALAASVAAGAGTCALFDLLSFPMVSGLMFVVAGCCAAAWRMRP